MTKININARPRIKFTLTENGTAMGLPGPSGADGTEIELQNSETHIQWRYAGETEWTNLIALADLTGPAGADGADGAPGADGADGREIELQNSGTHIQWRYTGDVTWNNLVALTDLTGPAGADGADGAPGTDGREVELQNSGTHIQWRYAGEVTWNNLIALADLTGPAGADGADGAPGADGREIEIQNSGTHIQWRYTGDVTWNNLVALADITGQQGEQGIQGEEGLSAYEVWLAEGNTGTEQDFLDSLQGEQGEPGTSLTKAVAGDVDAGTDDEKYTTSLALNQSMLGQKARHVSLGMTNFALYGDSLAKVDTMVSTHLVKGNFTVIKRFNAGVRAVGSNFITLRNTEGDEIFINNQAYNLTITLKKANVTIYNYTEDTSILFNNVTDIVLFIEVDYNLSQIRFSYADFSATYNIAELSQLKNTTFTYTEIGINSYRISCKFSYILNGLFNYDNLIKISPQSGGLYVPKDALIMATKNKCANLSILTGLPLSFWSNNSKNFVGGKVTYTYADCLGQSTGVNNYFFYEGLQIGNLINADLISDVNAIALYTFSLDVVSGILSVSDVTANNGIIVFRAIEKNTEQVIEFRNPNYTFIIDIPVGEWFIQIEVANSRDRYGQFAYQYVLGFRGITEDGEFIVYDDLEVMNIAVILSAMPTLASMNKIYCPFSDQFLTGYWELSNTYFT